VARRFLEAGRTVALLDHRAETLARARERIGRDVVVAVADVGDRRAVEDAVARVASHAGPPLVLVNGAGIAESRPLLPPDDDVWHRTMSVNATGTWIVSTACLPLMVAAKWGRIVNVASTAALRAYRYTAAYTASKHAVLGLTRAMALDLAEKGVTVNAVCPGFLDTPMTDRTVANIVKKTGRSEDEARATIAAMNPSGRLIRPEDVAERVFALVEGTTTGEAVVLE
jgi:NAD(P)-dependent dehydrogenase (short-subunit alcohol dehydrogenase family)